MRRYDAGYRALKAVAADGSIGMPLLAHMAHRNPSVPPTVTSEMAINDSVVHEIDVTRWLLDEEITAVMIMSPKRSRRAAEGLQDPMIVVFRTASGVLVDDELSVNVRYGYDIQAEIVGETGNARLANAGAITVTSERGRAAAVPADWRERFVGAYDEEFRAWIDDVARAARPAGPAHGMATRPRSSPTRPSGRCTPGAAGPASRSGTGPTSTGRRHEDRTGPVHAAPGAADGTARGGGRPRL